jgi:peptidoglycan/xylan/chitin deacetylase (PgdA/CDA1 family)
VGERAALQPDVIREQSDVGEVGSHSLDHALLTRLPEPAVRANLTSAGALLSDAGAGNVRLFRPPYGASSRAVAAAATSLGLLEVLYSVDSDDWREHDSEGVLRNVTPGLRPGAIVLLHEVCAHTVQAVPDIVAAARGRGLRLVTVPELLALDPPRSRLMVRAQRWGDHRRMTRARAAHRRDGGWDTRSMAVRSR